MSVNLVIENQGLESLRERLMRRAARAQNLLTEECKLAADEFTPVKSGSLRDNFSFIQEASGELSAKTGWVYHEPYAGRVWEGVGEEGSAGRFSGQAGSLAGNLARNRWTEHGAALRKEEILEKVRKELEK